jgi:alpha-L-fucosidase 2
MTRRGLCRRQLLWNLVGVALILAAAAARPGAAAASDTRLALTYDEPAARWTEALPVGNGRIGAMVFGGPEDDRLQINEGTLWGGSPRNYTDPEAHTRLEEIRRLIFAGKVAEAEKLSEGVMGSPKLLLISSSRPGGQPANLQGIWNEDLLPAWGSKWTTNINLEMNYWYADAGDLWETLEPLWSAVRDLRVTGAETARAHYAAKGWVLHHNTDLWRATTPVDGSWGLWPMGQVWLANQMWDHYDFSEDREFLRREAYPAMKGAAQFILDTLVPAPPGTPFAGRLVTIPSTSPENRYVLNGQPQQMTYGATMDIELIRELFENCARAAAILGTDADFRAELERTGQRLPPLQVGARGQLQEWIEDYPEAEPAHRHVSHLYALYPGSSIDVERTPPLAAAARKTLELRGDGGTGWATVWRIGLWARLRDADRAYANLKSLITRSTLPNMFDLHPPFQIDGNLGGPAVIAEMLVQSRTDEIRVLPALPRQWPSGSLTGVRVRGGGRADITWKDGRLTELRLQSDRAKTYRVSYGERSAEVRVGPGAPVVVDGTLQRVAR